MENIQVSENIRNDLNKFTDALRNTKEYVEYRRTAEAVDAKPELKERITNYRLMNYNLQQEMDPGVIAAKTEELERFYDELEQDPVAAEFLDAEMTFCRMMQEVSLAIYASMNFE